MLNAKHNPNLLAESGVNNMKDHKESLAAKSRRHYDKQMDYQFTVIFHNIKRLQEGHLSDSNPELRTIHRANDRLTDSNPEVYRAKDRLIPDTNEPTSLTVPRLMTRCHSDSNLAVDHDTPGKDRFGLEPSPRSKALSFSESSLPQRRKVRFADDMTSAMVETPPRRSLKRQPWSDLQPLLQNAGEIRLEVPVISRKK